MPLRTDRGKKAALRHFWTWPLRSPAHMVTTAVIAVVAITGIAIAASAIRPAKTTAVASTSTPTTGPVYPSWSSTRPAPTTSATGTSPTSPSTAASPTFTSAIAPNNTSLAVSAAKNFMTRWVRPPAGTSPEAWSRNLAPFVVPDSLVELKNIDPDNIPATKLTGDPKITDNVDAVVGVDVPTDAGVIHVVVINLPDGRWLVRKWLPVS